MMYSPLILLLLFPLLVADRFDHLHTMEETIGKEIVHIARAAGYEAELVGLVASMEDMTCKEVIYEWHDWINGSAFIKLVDGLLLSTGYPVGVSKHNQKEALLAVLEINQKGMKGVFEKATKTVKKWNPATENKTVSFEKATPPHHVLEMTVNADIRVKQTGYSVEMQVIAVQTFVGQLTMLSNELVRSFNDILSDLKSQKMSASLFSHVGGDATYRNLAKKILDSEYNGSFVEHFGDRMAELQKVQILGVQEDSLVTKVCMVSGKLKDAKAHVAIISHGILKGTNYTYPLLPRNYAATSDSKSLNDLVLATPVFSGDGLAIVEAFIDQSNKCRLQADEKCSHASVNIDNHDGTFVRELEHSSLVVTKMEKGRCINSNGEPLKIVTIRSPIFSHKHKHCLLQVGNKRIGNQTIHFEQIPDDFPTFVPNRGDEGAGIFGGWSIEIQIVFGVMGIVIVLLVGAVIIIIILHLRQNGKRAEDRRKTLEMLERY